MRTLTIAPQDLGPSLAVERIAGKPAPRMLLDTSAPAALRRPQQGAAALVRARPPELEAAPQCQTLAAALHKLQDVFFACCADYPSDEALEQRIRTECRRIEATLQPSDLREWRSSRDCMLARLGFRPLMG